MRHTTRRRGVTAITAAIALALPVAAFGVANVGVDPGSGPSPAGVSPAAVIDLPRTGSLELRTGATDEVVRLDAEGDPVGDPQGLSAGTRCLLSSTERLLEFTGTVGTGTSDLASFLNDGIGVAEKKSGTSCGQVGADTSERLLVALPAGAGLPSLIRSAQLDVELKQGARVLATAYRGRDSAGARVPVAYFDLAGTAVPKSKLVTTTLPYGWDRGSCGNRADNGPDSGAGDNCAWPIGPLDDAGSPVLVDAIELRAITGSFALEGGGDWGSSAAANRSTFQLVADADGILTCGAATVTRQDSGNAPQVTVRRLDNASSEEDCADIPYTLRNEPAAARFLKPLESQTTAQFVADFVWVRSVGATTALPATTVNFETGGGEIPIGWCPDPIYAGTIEIDGVTVPKLVGIASPLAASRPDLDAASGKQFACLGVQAARVVDGDTDSLRVVEQVYVLGDIRFTKP